MHVRVRIGIVCRTLCTLLEQCVVWIEDAFAYQLEPFFEEPTFIHALLIVELHRELLLPTL